MEQLITNRGSFFYEVIGVNVGSLIAICKEKFIRLFVSIACFSSALPKLQDSEIRMKKDECYADIERYAYLDIHFFCCNLTYHSVGISFCFPV